MKILKSKQFIWTAIGLALIMLVVAIWNGQNKANGLTQVVILKDNVPVYTKEDVNSEKLGLLGGGDSVKLLDYNIQFTAIELDSKKVYVETKFVDFSYSNLNPEDVAKLWNDMIKNGIIKAPSHYEGNVKRITKLKESVMYSPRTSVIDAIKNWNTNMNKKHFNTDVLVIIPGKEITEEEEGTITPVTPPVENPQPPVDPSPTPISESKDTFIVDYISDEKSYGYANIIVQNYTVLRDNVKVYSSGSTNSQVLKTFNKNDMLYVSADNEKYMLDSTVSGVKFNEWILVTITNPNVRPIVQGYVKRSDLATNYVVRVSRKDEANGLGYDYNNSNTSNLRRLDGYVIPYKNSAAILQTVVSAHDPYYDTLKAGTKLKASAITNSSVVKPKAGTGASTSKVIASTGTASGDGWVAATTTKRFESNPAGRNGFLVDLQQDLGFFFNTNRHMGLFFATNDGVILDVYTTGSDNFGRFSISGYSKTEAYRAKEMLKNAMPYFFENKYSLDTINKVHADFISYANAKPSASKTIAYNGFKATFSKTNNDVYTLTLHY